MNIEFHYYAIYYLASKAGFTDRDSWILASSSQFVDNNLIGYSISTNRGLYETDATQNYGWWDEKCIKDVYLPFHFFPGEPDNPVCKRIDNKTNLYNTTPNSPGVKKLLVDALKTKNLYRIGIALHTFADSYAHQNFSGLQEDWNSLDNSSFIPAVGHAQAMKKPDDLCGVWTDKRLAYQTGLVLNRERAFECAKKIYRYLRIYLGEDPDDHELILSYWNDLLGKPGAERSFEHRLQDYVIEWDIPPFEIEHWLEHAFDRKDVSSDIKKIPQYDKLLWLKDTLLTRGILNKKATVEGKEDFYQSHFYNWYEAAKEHRVDAQAYLNELISGI